MRQIAIIGDVFCTKHIQGISRYAYEIVKMLDLISGKLNIIICYPQGEKMLFTKLNNIKLLPLNVPKGKHFRKDVFRKYVNENNCVVIDFGPGYPYYKSSVITFHDVRPLERESVDSKKSRFSLKIMLIMAKYRRKTRIVTVSEYQRNRIHLLAQIPLSRIEVIGNGWEHIINVKADNRIFEKFPQINIGNYYYAIGSVAPHKNYKWVSEVAKRNGNAQFVVAGNIDSENWGIDDSGLKSQNVIFTGYISDEENVALLNNCNVFIHPSKYEGFGIPPLEAIALGKSVLISNATCLPEIYGNAAEYFDPDDYNIDLNQYEWNNLQSCKQVLLEHSWKNSAKKWEKIFEEVAM